MAEELTDRVRLALVRSGIVPDGGSSSVVVDPVPRILPGTSDIAAVSGERDASTGPTRSTPLPASATSVPSVDRDPPDSNVAAAWAGVLEVAARELAAASAAPGEWSDAALAVVVDAADRTARVLDAAKAPVLVAQERSGTWRRPGVRSFEAHRASQNREDIGTARREADAARTLTELEGGLEALARGEITTSHVQRLRVVTDKVDPEVRSELLTGESAAKVRDLAKEHDPKLFERKLEELAATRDPATVQDAHEAIRARRFLRIMPGPGGTRIEGFLDPVAGHRLQQAIEAASPRPGKDDKRPLGQRNADALETIAVATLHEGKLSPGTHVPTQVMITMTETTFLAAREHLATATHTNREAKSGAVDVEPFPLVRVQDGPLLPPADLGKLLCGSAVGRLVVDAESVPLNVGRSQRTFKSHQRRSVELRDQHCAWPDCAQIARYCEVHHLDHWAEDQGETDVHRGVLVCAFHHHELHTHDLDLVAAPRSGSRAGPALLPGDPDYEPPQYQLLPRAQTADDRRTRLAARLRQRAAANRAARSGDASPSPSPSPSPWPAPLGSGSPRRVGAQGEGVPRVMARQLDFEMPGSNIPPDVSAARGNIAS